MTSQVIYEFAGFRFEPQNLRLIHGAQVEDLNGKAAEVLLVLVRQPNTLVTRQTLIGAVWPDVAVEENNLSQQISLLRKVLSLPGGRELIETVPRHGYRLVAEVRTIEPAVAEGATPTSPFLTTAPPPAPVAAQPAQPRRLALVAGIAVVVSIGSVAWWWHLRQAPMRASQTVIDRAEALLRQGDAKSATAEFQNAIRLDPTNARAHASLANALHRYSTHDSTTRAADASPALDAAERSVALDPACGDCQGMLGFILTYHHWQWARAESHLVEAIRLEPGKEGIRPSFAMLLAATGRVKPAIDQIDVALAKRPVRAHVARDARHAALSRPALRRGARLDRSGARHRRRPSECVGVAGAGILFQTGRGDEAIRALAHGAFAEHTAALEQAVRDGGAEAALRLLLTVTGDWRTRDEQSWRRGPWRLLLGDVDGAFDELSRAYQLRNFNLIYAAVDPMCRPRPRRREIPAAAREHGAEPGHGRDQTRRTLTRRRQPEALPADLLPLDLFVEPRLQRREVVDDRRRVHLARSGQRLERVRPRLRRAHLQHRVEPRARLPCSRRSSSDGAASCSRRSSTARDGTGTGGCARGNSACTSSWPARDTSRPDRRTPRRAATAARRPGTSAADPTRPCCSRRGGILPENTSQRH